MGVGWAGKGGRAILPGVSAQPTWWMDTAECGGRDEADKIV